MRLTDHTDYSLRVLMYLNQKKELVTLNELAEALQISRNNLIKVSNRLAKQGFIDTSRGPGGWFDDSARGGYGLAERYYQQDRRDVSALQHPQRLFPDPCS